mmetsp:Transcript_98121/g.233539  ORF Transcript_98121/g.233539 Transcript_98121/m.233539 type:complete len:208 (-) Transcript_98121:361-984(-)
MLCSSQKCSLTICIHGRQICQMTNQTPRLVGVAERAAADFAEEPSSGSHNLVVVQLFGDLPQILRLDVALALPVPAGHQEGASVHLLCSNRREVRRQADDPTPLPARQTIWSALQRPRQVIHLQIPGSHAQQDALRQVRHQLQQGAKGGSLLRIGLKHRTGHSTATTHSLFLQSSPRFPCVGDVQTSLQAGHQAPQEAVPEVSWERL